MLLGWRWHTNTCTFANAHTRDVWPFYNLTGATSVACMTTNATVGIEALIVRSAVYAASNVTTVLPLALLISPPGTGNARMTGPDWVVDIMSRTQAGPERCGA